MRTVQGTIDTILGNGAEGWNGDGGPALEAACQTPYACEFDSHGNMFVCMGRHHRIRRMDVQTGVITLVGGTGSSGYAGDGGPALNATVNQPYALAIDVNGDIYFAVAESFPPLLVLGNSATAETAALATKPCSENLTTCI